MRGWDKRIKQLQLEKMQEVTEEIERLQKLVYEYTKNGAKISLKMGKYNSVTEDEAILFCTETECDDCPAGTENFEDWRTEYEKTTLHFPCYLNLVKDDERLHIRGLYNPQGK